MARSAPSTPAPVRRAYAAVGGAVLVAAPAEPLDWLPWFLADWPETPPPDRAPDIRVAAAGAGYRVEGPGGGRAASAAEAASLLVGAFVGVLTARDPGLFALHAAAVDTPAGAVVLVGASEAGKSTLALQMMAAGHRVLGDDLVLLRPRDDGLEAVALGALPKVRRPLPRALGSDFAAFVEARVVCDYGSQANLRPSPAELAPHGTQRPVARVVLLERHPAAAGATATPVATAALLRAVLAGAAGMQGAVAAQVAALAAALARVGGERLVHGSGGGALALLHARLAAGWGR